MKRVLIFVLILFCITIAQMTYLNVFSFSPDFTENKLVPIIISADGPYPDTIYSGMARLSIIEEYPNYSAGFVDPSTGDYDTVLDIDIFGDEEVFYLVSDYENEFIIIIAEDTLNELKTSIPLGIEVNECGDSAVRLAYLGPKIISSRTEEFKVLSRIAPVDTIDREVADYYLDLLEENAIELSVFNEEFEDSSSQIYNLFTDSLSRSVILPSIGGNIYFALINEDAESVVFRVVDIYSDFDTSYFSIDFTEDASMLSINYLTGIANAFNSNVPVFLTSIGSNGIDLSDDSTNVFMNVKDIDDPRLANIEPLGKILNNGIATFKLFNPTIDSMGVFVKPKVVSEKELYSPFWSPFIFLMEGHAISILYDGPTLFIIRDTVDISIFAVDQMGNKDTSYWGYFLPETSDTGIIFIDTTSGIEYSWPFEPIPFNNGEKHFQIVLPNYSVEFEMQFKDGEERTFMGTGMLAPSKTIYAKVRGTAVTTAVVLDISAKNSKRMLEINRFHRVDVAAIDFLGQVDLSYNRDLAIRIIGSAIAFPPDYVFLTRGLGSFIIRSDFPEVVELTLSDVMLDTTVTFYFHEPFKAGIPIIYTRTEEIIVNEPREFSVVLINDYNPAMFYSGIASLDAIDSDTNHSFLIPLNFLIEDGFGEFTFTGMEAEEFYITISPEFQPSSVNTVETYFILDVSYPDSVTLPGTGRMNVKALDYFDDIFKIGVSFDVSLIESNEDSSAIPSRIHITLRDGERALSVRDLYAESVYVCLKPIDFDLILAPNAFIDTVKGYCFGPIIFTENSVEEKKVPNVIDIVKIIPNPFNDNTIVEISLAKPENINIELYDLQGKLVSEKNIFLKSGINQVEIPIEDNLSSGIYLVHIKTKDKAFTRKAFLIR